MADKKAPEKKSKSKPRHKMYDGAKVRNRSCPKCGAGYFLAEHKDHRTCGKCRYVEAKDKAPKEPKEPTAPKQEKIGTAKEPEQPKVKEKTATAPAGAKPVDKPDVQQVEAE